MTSNGKSMTEEQWAQKHRAQAEQAGAVIINTIGNNVYEAISNAMPAVEDSESIISKAVHNALSDAMPPKEAIYEAIAEGVKEAFSEYLEKHGLPDNAKRGGQARR